MVVVWKESPLEGLGFEKLNPPPGFEFVQSILLWSVEDANVGEKDRNVALGNLRKMQNGVADQRF